MGPVPLDGNPLDNIANTLTVWKVVLGGRCSKNVSRSPQRAAKM
jgi:hypothetical protein